MTKERNALKAGIFIIVSIVLIIGIVVAIKGLGRFLEPMQLVTVSFSLIDDVGGLSTGDEVRVGGAKVGAVRSVELVDAPEGEHRIIVTCELPKRFTVHKDAVVSIQAPFVGVTDLNFTRLGNGGPLGAGEMLEGKPAPLTALLDTAPDIMGIIADIRKVTLPKVNNTVDRVGDTIGAYKQAGDSANELLVHARGKVDPVVERYNGVADSAKGALDQLGDIFGDTKPDIRATMANLREMTGTVNQRMPGLIDKADGALTNIVTGVNNINVVLEDVKQIAENTREFTGSARSILVTNRGKIDAMVTSLKATSDNLKGASAEVRRSPWRLLYQPSGDELNNLNLYDTTRQFADGANQLNEAALSLRDAAKDPKLEQAQLQKLIERLDKTFATFNELEQELWKQVQE